MVFLRALTIKVIDYISCMYAYTLTLAPWFYCAPPQDNLRDRPFHYLRGGGRLFEKIIWSCFWMKKIIWSSLYVNKFFGFDVLQENNLLDRQRGRNSCLPYMTIFKNLTFNSL